MNSLQNNFRNNITPAERQQFSKLQRDDKYAWLSQWLLDPEECKKNGFPKVRAYVQEDSISDNMWATKEQLEGPRFFNSAAIVKILLENEELESKPSRYPSLASLGYLEYRVTEDILRQMNGTRSESGVKASTDVTCDEYTTIKTSLEGAVGVPASKRKAAARDVQIDPRIKELREACGKLAATLRQVKKRHRRVRNVCVHSARTHQQTFDKRLPRSHANILQ